MKRFLGALGAWLLLYGPAYAAVPPYPSATLPLTGAEPLICWQGGVTKSCSVSSIGAFAGTIPANITPTPPPFPNNFYSEDGAKIVRVNDRFFAGGATANDGTYVNRFAYADWLSKLFGAAYGLVGNSQNAFETTNGLIGLTVGSEGANAQTGAPVYGVFSMVFDNNVSHGNGLEAGYFEARTYQQTVDGAMNAVEIDPVNVSGSDARTDFSPYTPYNTTAANYMFALQLASGGGFDGSAGVPNFGVQANNTSQGINFANNGAKMAAGIVFDAGALVGDDGTTGSAAAIEFAKGHEEEWFGPGATGLTSYIWSNASTSVNGSYIDMEDGYVGIGALSGASSVKFGTSSTFVNTMLIQGSATGSPEILSASGSDSLINIEAEPKGGGFFITGGFGRIVTTNVAGLATDSAPTAGDTIVITDARSCSANQPVTGGGAQSCFVMYSGAMWKAVVSNPAQAAITTNWYAPAGVLAVAGAAMTQNTIYLSPFTVSLPLTVVGLAGRITTTSGGNHVQLAIYAGNATTGRPTGAALCSTGDLSTASAAAVSAGSLTCNGARPLVPGVIYWMASNADNSVAALESDGSGAMAKAFGSATLGNVSVSGTVLGPTGVSTPQTYNTWPDVTSNTFTEVTTALPPLVFLQSQ